MVTMMVRGLNRTAVANVRGTSEFVAASFDDLLRGELQGMPDSLGGQWFQRRSRIPTNVLSPAGSDTANRLHLGVAQLRSVSGTFVRYEVRVIVVRFDQSTGSENGRRGRPWRASTLRHE